ncbi:hypothetical protein V1517DRAFT_341904, partial [Lipomyces orientalis]
MGPTAVDEALNFIKEGSGRRHVGKMTPVQFDKLVAKVGDDQRYCIAFVYGEVERWPRIQYYAPDQEVVIDNFPLSAAHQVLADYFLDEIKHSIPLGLQSRVMFSGHTRSGFTGHWGQSSKTPDGALLYRSVITNMSAMTMILEVGVSETMRKLERDAQMLLLGLRQETPNYHVPPPGIVGPYTDIDEEAAAAAAAMFQNRMDVVDLGSPVIYRGLAWVNSLTGRVSVYKATPDFSDIVCVSVTDLPLALTDNVTDYQRIGLWYSCFLPMEELSLMHVEDREVPFNFVTLHGMIRNAVAELGRLRYVDYLEDN